MTTLATTTMTSRGMFEWFFPTPELELPGDSRSLQWECFVDACPPAPSNTLEYQVDPIQELFGVTISSIQNKMWNEYHQNMKHELNMKAAAFQDASSYSA